MWRRTPVGNLGEVSFVFGASVGNHNYSLQVRQTCECERKTENEAFVLFSHYALV